MEKTRIVLGEGLLVLGLEHEEVPLVRIIQEVGAATPVQRQLGFNSRDEGVAHFVQRVQELLALKPPSRTHLIELHF